MPKTYNVCILGPHSSGKLSIAKKLAERYGWKLIHFPQILKDTVFK
jgi:cytidylate kinase